jgi:NADPH:quinone reductase-like Zn-dependent oxidoreductase
MKAITRERYGSPDVLELTESEKPLVDDGRVLVRVRAASVNAYDWHMLRGEPFLARMSDGMRKPKTLVTGMDLAGEVEAVGRNVTEFRPGDAVFGQRSGAFAEYVSAKPSNFAPKPANLSFEQAAAVPMAGVTALQGLRDKGQLRPGQRVLVNGAAGGVGTFAVQIAKALGAHVTGVCGTNHVETVRSIGADQVIDYTKEDFTRSGQRYDLILDVAGSRSLSDCRRVLGPDGRLVMVGPGGGGRRIVPIVARILAALVTNRFAKQRILLFLGQPSNDDLIVLKELIEAGKIRPVIDRTYPLGQTAEAIRYLEQGHAGGKVVIVV